MQSFLSEERYSPTYNWLFLSKSSYLKQHERNLVNWLEWSIEAFYKAERENKLILLKMGHLISHHFEAINREFFENEEIVRLLNEHFICVMVDRNELPEIIKQFENSFLQENKNDKGPMILFLTPKQEVFYNGPLPPQNSGLALRELLCKLHEQYKKLNDGSC